MSMKLGNQSISCTTKMNCSSHKSVSRNYHVNENDECYDEFNEDKNFVDDENIPLSLQFSINSFCTLLSVRLVYLFVFRDCYRCKL